MTIFRVPKGTLQVGDKISIQTQTQTQTEPRNVGRKEIFVFGSNLRGVHGAGAALSARQKHGAKPGIGFGLQGDSYAIPTKDYNLKPLPLETIKVRVRDFVAFARLHPEMKFNVTRIGCGRAGYTDAQIAPMFHEAPNNCRLPVGWRGA